MPDEPEADDAEEMRRRKKAEEAERKKMKWAAIAVESIAVSFGLISIGIGFLLSRSKNSDPLHSFWISLAIGVGTSLLLVGILFRVQRIIGGRLDAASEALYTRQEEITKQLNEVMERLVEIQRETSDGPVPPATQQEVTIERPRRTMVLEDWLVAVLLWIISNLANAGRGAKRWARRPRRVLIVIAVLIIAVVAVLTIVRIVDGPSYNGGGHAASSGVGDCDHDGDAGDSNEANECGQQSGSGSTISAPPQTSPSTTVPLHTGEQILTDGGTVIGINEAPAFGSTTLLPSGVHAVGIATTSDGRGYWVATSDGGVQNFGDAPFFGSAAGASSQPIVGIAALPNDEGYWLLNASGQVYTRGQAQYFGGYQPGPGSHYYNFSGIASTGTGKGYWLAEEDGHVYPFGDATNLGGPSLSLPTSTSPFIVGIVAAPDGKGYWLLNTDGTVYNYGEPALGSSPSDTRTAGTSGSASAIAVDPIGGYSVLNLCGDVWSSTGGNVDSSAEDCAIRHVSLAQ